MRYLRHFCKYKHQFLSALRFYWQAKTIYNIHSPLLYNLLPIVNKLDSSDAKKMQAISHLTDKLKTDQTIINHEDFGEGSRHLNDFKKKSIKDIYLASSTKLFKGNKIYKICQFFQPKSILELGTNLGLGTSFLALANSKARITTVEGDPSLAEISKQNIGALDIHNVKIVNNKFDDYFQTTSGSKNHDFVFIDGNHNYEATLKYFDLCFNETLNNQVIILDDIYWSEGMTKAWYDIQGKIKNGYCIDFFDFGVIIKSNELEHAIKIKYIEKKWKPLSFGFWG